MRKGLANSMIECRIGVFDARSLKNCFKINPALRGTVQYYEKKLLFVYLAFFFSKMKRSILPITEHLSWPGAENMSIKVQFHFGIWGIKRLKQSDL